MRNNFPPGCVRRLGGKPARAEAAGDAAAKKRACKLFLPLASPRLVPADLEPGTDPERSEGTRPNKN
ncbi:MAG TPA: hypothetical protein GXZ40_07635 [Bacteroidales bacterium]|nr:hypothetical protein [Bacteroidales bacterium]